ncbi:MAG: hypothetical protein AAF529_14350 [Pseudomonadota bacterium]
MNRPLLTFLLLTATAGLGACAGQSPTSYSWYHPQGGEYLFDYDKNTCEAQHLEPSRKPGVEGPFFSCMLDLGYYLVQDGQILRAPDETTILPKTDTAGAD